LDVLQEPVVGGGAVFFFLQHSKALHENLSSAFDGVAPGPGSGGDADALTISLTRQVCLAAAARILLGG